MTHTFSVNILVARQMTEKFSLIAFSLQGKIYLLAVISFYRLYGCLFTKQFPGHPFFDNSKTHYYVCFIKQQPICFTLREHFSVLLK